MGFEKYREYKRMKLVKEIQNSEQGYLYHLKVIRKVCENTNYISIKAILYDKERQLITGGVFEGKLQILDSQTLKLSKEL